MVCLERELRSFCCFWDCTDVLHFGLFCQLSGPLHFFLDSNQFLKRRVPFSHLSLQHFLSVDFFFMMAFLTSVRSFLIRDLICISLIMSDIEHFFTCLLAICMSSLGKCLFRSSGHFLFTLFVSLILSYLSCLCILEVNLCQSFYLQLFSPIVWAIFSSCL